MPLGVRGQSSDRVPKVVLVTFTPATRNALVAVSKSLDTKRGGTSLLTGGARSNQAMHPPTCKTSFS